MTRIRIGFGTAVVATAVLFFLSGSYFTAGVFIIEILLPVVLRFFLRLETNGMELEMHTRSACRLGQTIEIDISVKSRWRCLAAARIQADLSYDNKMFQVSRNIPLALDVNKRSFGISIPWEPKMCGGAILSLSNVRCYDIFGLNCIKTEFHQVQHLTVYPEKISMRPVASGNQKGRQNEGQQTLSKKGYDATEVFELREYQPGDSIRQIHWKLSGKLDDIMIREKSFPVDDTVLILAEAFQTERDPKRAETVAEVLSAVLRDFMEKKIPCQVGIYDRSTGKFRQEKVRKEEDHEHVLYGFLRYGSDEKTPVTVQEYLKNPGAQNFANYIYITGDPEDKEAELLKQKGEVTVIGCGVSSGDNKGEQITWKYGSQNPEDSQKQNTENSCQISCWKLR